MTYLIAKRIDSPGCLAVRTETGKSLAELVSELGKYKQYHFVDSSETFIVTVHGHFLN